MRDVLLVLLAATVLGVLWRSRQGRFREVRPGGRADEHDGGLGEQVRALGAGLGDRATLLQLSSATCAPCRATRILLADLADTEPGVVHVEVDAEAHLELVRRLHVRATPTTLVLDAQGREVGRAAGAPRRDDVLAALP